METGFYREQLCQMQENYKRKPLHDIFLKRPHWLKDDDPMTEVFLKKTELLRKGEIVYATIVQANTILFNRFPLVDCPANIVFSTQAYSDDSTQLLYDIAMKIYAYKNKPLHTVPDEWKEMARVVTDEYDRSDFTFSVNLGGTSMVCQMIPTMVFRKLLPKGKLCGSILPVLTVQGCKQVLILPKRYWTKEFKRAWKEGKI